MNDGSEPRAGDSSPAGTIARRTVLAGIGTAVLGTVAGASAGRKERERTSDGLWPRPNGLRRRKYVPDSDVGPGEDPTTRWTADRNTTRIAYADGTVIAGRGTGEVDLYDVATGDRRATVAAEDGSVVKLGYYDGRVYAATTTSKFVTATVEGDDVKRRQFEAIPSTPVAANEGLYVGTAGGRVLRLDPSTGETVDFFDVEGISGRVLELVSDGSTLYGWSRIGESTTAVFAVDPEAGSTEWVQSVDGGATAQFADGALVLYRRVDGSEFLHELDAGTGDERWEYEASDGVGLGAPVVTEDRIVYGYTRLVAVDRADGTEDWRADVDTHRAVASGDTLWVAPRESGKILAVDPTSGDLRWEYSAEVDGFIGNLTVTDSGIVGKGAELVAIGDDAAATGTAESDDGSTDDEDGSESGDGDANEGEEDDESGGGTPGVGAVGALGALGAGAWSIKRSRDDEG